MPAPANEGPHQVTGPSPETEAASPPPAAPLSNEGPQQTATESTLSVAAAPSPDYLGLIANKLKEAQTADTVWQQNLGRALRRDFPWVVVNARIDPVAAIRAGNVAVEDQARLLATLREQMPEPALT